MMSMLLLRIVEISNILQQISPRSSENAVVGECEEAEGADRHEILKNF